MWLYRNGLLQPKVDQYWPPNAMEPVSYGEITVEMTSVSQLNKFIIRIFKLSLVRQIYGKFHLLKHSTHFVND